MGFLEMGAPEDEYDPEVGTILPRLQLSLSESELCCIIHQELPHWLGKATTGPVSAYKNIDSTFGKDIMVSEAFKRSCQYTAVSSGGTLVNSRPCTQRYVH
ncbi:hypothetical protein [Zobellella sp. DQSA1]|uniref:hypothetical protein n=1 Tax=Zobellella sp. DQSA1 TaxID=3342386 RepID=UPI0035C04A88